MKQALLCVLALLAPSVTQAQTQGLRLWPAKWIDVRGSSPQGYGVYHFRKTFEASSSPASFVIHVSGDNRYQLFVNGKLVSAGPARSDLTHWAYETVDIAAQVRPGRNVLAAVVWNDGPYRAIAQISNQTGFLLQAEDAANSAVNTGHDWKGVQDRAYSPQPLPSDQATGYYALAANEKFDAQAYPWGWEAADFDDSAWSAAHEIGAASPRDSRDGPNRWMLVERSIPLEEQTPEDAMRPVRFDAATQTGASFRIAPNSTAHILYDLGHLTTAYPEIQVTGGKGSQVDVRYAETLYVRKNGPGVSTQKGNRNDTEGKTLYGPADTYLGDGNTHTYRPLFWRTYRYVELSVATGSAEATVSAPATTFTGYPFTRKAQLSTTDRLDEELKRILSTGWRTARLCAHETYMDCPFYEQLQYGGDARIQMMVSLYMTGDARLMRRGIELLNQSRTAEGATFSRAPSALQQYIPPFSLWWIGMVHDYWMYVDDPQFAKEMLPGVQAVLSFYARFQKPNGSLGKMPWWNFVDWVKQWPNGEPPAEADGSSAAALDLQLLLAYGWAADLERALGSTALASAYADAGAQLKSTILEMDWDKSRGLFADQPSHRTYSQHVNTLAVLGHIISPAEAHSVMQKVFSDATLAPASIYFRAYTNAALREAGMGDEYVSKLGPWREMLGDGLTTWAEWNGPDSRSDCHAWGASPNFELLRTVAGIDSAAPGFRKVRIAPNLGTLPDLTAQAPSPAGLIQLKLQHKGSHLTADVELPPGITGDFVWNASTKALRPGSNHLEF